MGRALAILAVAVPVLAWFVTGIALLGFYDVTSGTPIAPWKWALASAMVLGAAATVAVSARIVWRSRGDVVWRVYGAILAAGVIAGSAAGVWLAGAEILRREEALAAEVTALCQRFDMPAASCPGVARACIAHLRAHPPTTVEPADDPRAPRNPDDLAAWRCVQRGGPAE